MSVPSTDLALESTLAVMGIPIHFRSNASELIRSFDETLAKWKTVLLEPDSMSEDLIQGRLLLNSGDEGPLPTTVSYSFPDFDRLLVTTPGSHAESNPARRTFDGSVTKALLANEEHFRRRVLETLVLSVVTRLDRYPVHASAVTDGSAALLFIGPSGTGKSTLAYAAARAGLGVLSEDTVFVQRAPTLRVWGMPGPIHLPPDAVRYFPELVGVPARLLPTGKFKLVLSPDDIRIPCASASSFRPGASTPLSGARVRVCLVARSTDHSCRSEPVPAARVEEALIHSPEPGFDLFSNEERRAVARVLAAPGGWTLRVGADPSLAVDAMREMLDGDVI